MQNSTSKEYEELIALRDERRKKKILELLDEPPCRASMKNSGKQKDDKKEREVENTKRSLAMIKVELRDEIMRKTWNSKKEMMKHSETRNVT